MADLHDLQNEIGDTSERVDRRLGLIQWIEVARQLLHEIQSTAAIDTTFGALLKQHDIRFNQFWEGRHSEALFELIEDVAQSVAAMNSAAESFAEARAGSCQ